MKEQPTQSRIAKDVIMITLFCALIITIIIAATQNHLKSDGLIENKTLKDSLVFIKDQHEKEMNSLIKSYENRIDLDFIGIVTSCKENGINVVKFVNIVYSPYLDLNNKTDYVQCDLFFPESGGYSVGTKFRLITVN